MPDRARDPAAAARYWGERNAERWRAALELEAREGLAVCDTDPFKLHYAWSLWWTGEASRGAYWHEAVVNRELFAAGDLGLADAVLLADVSAAQARVQRDGDASRGRRHFAVHVRLREPLALWYAAVDRLDPGRVHAGLPADGLPDALRARGPRSRRSSTTRFDALLWDLERPPLVSGE